LESRDKLLEKNLDITAATKFTTTNCELHDHYNDCTRVLHVHIYTITPDANNSN